MSSVKGSKQYSMRVVPHRPALSLLRFVLLLLVLALLAAGAYVWGYWQASGGNVPTGKTREQLQVQLNEAHSESERLRQQVANLRMASEVDRQASEDVRGEVIELRRQIASLEADISFYRGLMAPGESGGGLALGDITLQALGAERHYRFKFVVQQIATNHQVLNGSLTVDILGTNSSGEVERLPLQQISPDYSDNNIKLRFKYFQNIEGELTLPPGFEPEQVELVASESGNGAASVERTYGWLTGQSQ